MIYGILVVSAVIFLCILANKFSDKFGMPTLILFMFIGMLFGSDGIVKIPGLRHLFNLKLLTSRRNAVFFCQIFLNYMLCGVVFYVIIKYEDLV